MSTKPIGRFMEILLVEDSLVDAQFTIISLRRGQVQHRLTLVRDGLEAIEFLRREGRFARTPRPDLVLLDLELPGLDGRQVLEAMKEDEKLADIPVVIMSASDDPQDMAQTRTLGVDAYITKPVDVTQFLDVIRQLKRFWHADLILPVL